MRIPFFDLSRQYNKIKEEIEPAVLEILQSANYIGGDAVADFEGEIANYVGTKYAISCGNGTDALRIALKAIGVSEGDEVITSPFTFFATAEVIAQVGATPVFADIDEDTFNISVESIEEKITKKTKAILPVHIFGLPADMDEINCVAQKYNLYVIEDACQAIGATYKNRKTGNLGDLGCFSFYPTKNLGAFGDGGMITTNDEKLAAVCRAIKSHASGKIGAEAYSYLNPNNFVDKLDLQGGDHLYDPFKYYNYFIGENSRLDALQAVVLRKKLAYLDNYNNSRREIAYKYSTDLSKLPIKIPAVEYKDRISCFHQYAILSEEKEELTSYLANAGIGTGAFYPVPLHLQYAFRYLGYKEGSLSVAERVCRQSVCLPVFPELSEDEIRYIIQNITNFYKERGMA